VVFSQRVGRMQDPHWGQVQSHFLV